LLKNYDNPMKKTGLIIAAILAASIFCSAERTIAQNDRLALTIRPPLVKVNMNPGESWSSTIQVVNNNPMPVAVLPIVKDYISNESGAIKFIDQEDMDSDVKSRYFLSEWIAIDPQSIEIPAGKSVEIPYSIMLPADISPGGHYAAILIGTMPTDEIQGTGISVSSMMASLLMLRVKGEIVEKARILDFSSDKALYQNPSLNFKVNFENLGNIHLQPQGDIRIFDMFGKARGIIAINQNSDAGNVFPESSRMWSFNWSDKPGLSKMGRYKAVLSLTYGQEARQTDARTIYFWVINFKSIGIIGGLIALFAGLGVFSVKYYIRKTVRTVQQELELARKAQEQGEIPQKKYARRKKSL